MGTDWPEEWSVTDMSINLYAYTYPSHELELREKIKDPTSSVLPYAGLWVKIGDSHRDPMLRMSEQGGASEQAKKIVLGTWLDVNTIQRDYEVHHELTLRGYRQDAYATGAGTEWFLIPGKSNNEVLAEINSVLDSFGEGTSKTKVKLREQQSFALKKAMDIIRLSKKNGQDKINIVANLCPRFGKTIWALSVFNEISKKYNTNIMLLPAYWLSVHTSFGDEVEKYYEFKNMRVFDTRDEDAGRKVREALKQGHQVVLMNSLHGDVDVWTDKLKWLQTLLKKENVFVFSDEADFGSHTENQVNKLQSMIAAQYASHSITIFASGTNIQRIAKNATGQTIDGVISVAYSQLGNGVVQRKYYSLRYDGLYDLLDEQFTDEQRPSWSKIWARPRKCQDYLTMTFAGLLGKNDDLCGLNLSHITGEPVNGIMVFTSADKAGMNSAGTFLGQEFPDYRFIVLNGDETTNREAEDEVRTAINEAKLIGQKGFVIITNMMGSRSFSIPEIQAAVIMYDRGGEDATAQKVSRCLTPGVDWFGNKKEVGHICSFSFDPNRNEVIEKLILYETVLVQNSTNESFPNALRFVYKTPNVYHIHDVGDPVLVSIDDLLRTYEENENILKIADVSVDINLCVRDNILDILKQVTSGDSGKSKSKFEKLAGKAKTFVPNKTSTSTNKTLVDKTLEKLITTAIRSINQSATTVYNMAVSGESYRECVEYIGVIPKLTKEFVDLYGITPSDVITLVDEGVLRVALLDVVVQNSAREFNKSPFKKV